MEVVPLEPDVTHLLVGDLLPGRVAALVEAGFHDEAAAVRRVADEVDGFRTCGAACLASSS